MIVFRVENKDGRGPYSVHGTTGQPFAVDNRPMPDEDGLLPMATPNEWQRRYGFASITAYLDWFESDDVRDRMHERGFHIVKYEVPEDSILIGGCQLLFDKTQAMMIECLGLNEVAA